MEEPKDLKGEKETNVDSQVQNETRDSRELTGPIANDSGQLADNNPVNELIEKFMPLAGLLGPLVIGTLPIPFLGSIAGLAAGAGAYPLLKKRGKAFPDLGAPRLEDAIFQILQSDQAPVGFFIKDLSNKYVYVNPPMAKFLGKPASDIVGLTDAQVYPDQDETVSTRSLEQVISGEMVHFQRSRMVEGVPTTVQEILVAKRGTRYEAVGVYGISWEIREPGTLTDLSGIEDTEYPSQIMRLTLRECSRLA